MRSIIHAFKVVERIAFTSVFLLLFEGNALAQGIFHQLNTPFYDPNSTTSTSQCGPTSLSGADNEEKVWNYFKGKGLSDAQTAGVMGNIQQESGFDPQDMEKGGDSQNPADADPKGWGLVQWTPGSRVIGIAQGLNITGPIYSLSTELDIVWGEMKGTSPVGAQNIVAQIMTMSDPVTVATYFDKNFEGGSDPDGIRETYAKQIYQQYGGSGSSSPVDTTGESCGNSGSLSPDCQSASGVAKILCAAKVYDPVSYSETVAGGHQGATAWHATCPTVGPSCILDCSGLVNIAVYDVYGADLRENTFSEVTDSQYWKKIPYSQLQPGDLIQPGQYNGNHVEIVDHIQGKLVYTFGAHSASYPQPKQVGPAQIQAESDDVYLHYVGPGANGG